MDACPDCGTPIHLSEGVRLRDAELPQDRDPVEITQPQAETEEVTNPVLPPAPQRSTAAERVAQISKDRNFTGYEKYENPHFK